jgi:hypothetical protein
MGGGKAPQAPAPVTIGQDISQIVGNNTNILGAEQFMEPSLAGLSNQISGQNVNAFMQMLNGGINTGAGNAAGAGNAFNVGQFGSTLPGMSSDILGQQGNIASAVTAANPALQYSAPAIQGALNNFNSADATLKDATGVLNSAGGSLEGMLSPTGLGGQMGQLAQSQLALGGTLSPQELNMVDQQTAATFSQNGLFNSNPAAATDLLNRDQYSQQRLAQREGFANQTMNSLTNTAGTLGQVGSGLGQIGSTYGQIGSQEGQIGTNLANIQNQAQMGLTSDILGATQAYANPNNFWNEQGMLASMFKNNNSLPTFIDSLIGTANSNGQFNAQSQFAAQAANAQLQNQQNAAYMQGAISLGIGTATLSTAAATAN